MALTFGNQFGIFDPKTETDAVASAGVMMAAPIALVGAVVGAVAYPKDVKVGSAAGAALSLGAVGLVTNGFGYGLGWEAVVAGAGAAGAVLGAMWHDHPTIGASLGASVGASIAAVATAYMGTVSS